METRFIGDRRLSFSASVLSLSFFPSDPFVWRQTCRPPREWFEAKTQFAAVFGERFVSQ